LCETFRWIELHSNLPATDRRSEVALWEKEHEAHPKWLEQPVSPGMGLSCMSKQAVALDDLDADGISDSQSNNSRTSL
jgi:hypothetical protein